MNRDLAQAVTIRETAKELLPARSWEQNTKLCLPRLRPLSAYRRRSPFSTSSVRSAAHVRRFTRHWKPRLPRKRIHSRSSSVRRPRPTAISLSILIDDALAGHDPHVVVKLYSAPATLDPFAEETIRLANPGVRCVHEHVARSSRWRPTPNGCRRARSNSAI